MLLLMKILDAVPYILGWAVIGVLLWAFLFGADVSIHLHNPIETWRKYKGE